MADINISEQKIVGKLRLGILILIVMHLFMQTANIGFGHDSVLGLVQLFDLDAEFNLPATFSFLLFMFSVVLIAAIANYARKEKRRFYLQWLVMAFIFLCLSFDELFSFHEHWSLPLRHCLHTSGLFSYPWQLPYAVFFLGMLVHYIPFWKNLNPQVRSRMTWAMGLYLLGVVVMESLGSWYYSVHGPAQAIYVAFSTAEETLEMSGLTVFISALLEHLRLEGSQLIVKIEK